MMVVECIRLKLHRTLKTRFDKEFKAGLEEPATPAAATALADLTRALMVSGVAYYGQKTHAKKVLAYVEKAAKADFTEAQMETICAALVDLKSVRAARRFLERGAAKFPADPMFPYLEALTYMTGDLENVRAYQVEAAAGERPAAGGGAAAGRPAGQVVARHPGPPQRPGRRQPVRHGLHDGHVRECSTGTTTTTITTTDFSALASGERGWG